MHHKLSHWKFKRDIAMEETKNLKNIISKVAKEIVPIPENITNLIRMLKSDTAMVPDISKQLAKDPVLTADTLRVVNSAYYSLTQEIKSLEQAIVVMGTRTLLRLVLAAWAKKVASREVKTFKIKPGELAVFSLVGAYAATYFANLGNIKFASDITFTAGVLRTLGRLVIDYMGHNVVSAILKEVFEKKISFHTATERVLGFSHSEITAELLKEWGIPEDLITVVRYYPFPSKFQGDKNLAKVISAVHLGDIVAMQIGEGAPMDSMLYVVDQKVFEILELKEDTDHIANACEAIIPEIQKLKDTFQLSEI